MLIKAAKEILFTIWLAFNALLRASVVIVPLVLIVGGNWAGALVFIVIWFVVFAFIDAI